MELVESGREGENATVRKVNKFGGRGSTLKFGPAVPATCLRLRGLGAQFGASIVKM